MKSLLKLAFGAVLLSAAVNLFASPSFAGEPHSPPNWKVSAEGKSTFAGIIMIDGAPYAIDVDDLGGYSTHVGQFTAEGAHFLNLIDFTFFGYATWTVSNGDTLNITYDGYIALSDDPLYPFDAYGEFHAQGGTGRLASASGHAQMVGGFTGEPAREYYFTLDGTLHPRGK